MFYRRKQRKRAEEEAAARNAMTWYAPLSEQFGIEPSELVRVDGPNSAPADPATLSIRVAGVPQKTYRDFVSTGASQWSTADARKKRDQLENPVGFSKDGGLVIIDRKIIEKDKKILRRYTNLTFVKNEIERHRRAKQRIEDSRLFI